MMSRTLRCCCEENIFGPARSAAGSSQQLPRIIQEKKNLGAVSPVGKDVEKRTLWGIPVGAELEEKRDNKGRSRS